MNESDKKLREQRILEIVVQSYIVTATPISSRYVSRRLGLSSATIRNTMSDLEEMGQIAHPYTSAGRVPTDKGYRYYVDSLMHLKEATQTDVREIESEYHSKVKSLEDMLEKTAHILSRLTSCASAALLPQLEQRLFKYINLVSISKREVLVLLVAESGFVNNYIIELKYPIDKTLLDKVSNFLNSRLFYNMRFEDIKNHLIRKLQEERNASYKLINAAYEIIKAALVEGLKEKLYLDGASQILAYPEFQDQKRWSNILRFLEEKKVISDILSEDLYEDKLKVRIGSENKTFGLDEFSTITAGFKIKDETAGRLGIIGPTRMDYDRIIPIVGLLARTVTKALS